MDNKVDSNEKLELSPELLQQLTENRYSPDDEIDLAELWRAIWRGKWLIIAITSLFVLASVFYALSLPNMYKSEVLLAPVEKQSSGLGGMASQLGGLASLAGVNLGAGKTDKTGLALEIMQSRGFVFKFIEQYEITPELMAVKNWNLATNELIYDTELYDVTRKKWLREAKAPFQSKPSLQESYRKFMELFSVEQDRDTAMVVVSIEHLSPYIAQQWVNWLVESINAEMKQKALTEANDSIDYLNSQLNQTQVAAYQSVLYQLIEAQTKTIMFANVKKEYILETVDPALVPEKKSGPKRALICAAGTILGALIAIFIVIIRYFAKKN